MKISLKNSGVLNSGAAIPPTSAHMEFGELAINYSSTDPSIFIKDSAGAIRRLVGVGNISFDNYQAIVPVVSTSPANVAQGNLYWDTGNERLYIYNGSAWKTATTLPFNEATIPDVTNASDQSGTFDDRYLRKSGGSITGALSTSNPITSSASYIRLNNSTLDYQGASDGSGGYFKTTLDNVNATANRTILLPNISGTLITTADSGTVTASMIGSGEITNTQISNSANINASKIATGVLPSGLQVNSTNIVDGSIVDADVNASAAITLTKLGTGTLPSGIQVVDANLNAGISASKVNTGTLGSNVVITASNYQAGSISNVAINASAEIDVSKLADGGARQLLQTDSTGNNVEWTSNVDIPGTLDVTGNAVFDNPVTINDVLTVNSTEIVLNSPIISITDKNITLNNVSSPSDANAAGGGFTIKGTTDKTYTYDGTHYAFSSSENINLGTTNKAYKIAGANVLTATALGSGVVGSNLTSVGTISSGTWQGSAITDAYLNTITTSGKVANSATTATSSNTPNAIVSRDGSGDITVRNVNGALIGNASTATALQTARTIALTGHITGSASFDGTSNISINSTINTTVTDTNLTWTASTRTLASSTGTDAVITLFDSSNAGLTPASGGGTSNFLRADGYWEVPTYPPTNLSYTASSSTIHSSTGSDVSLPAFTDYNKGLTPASGGGTTKFLRADGTWVTIGSGTQGSDLAYVTATRTVTNTNGTGFVLPLATTSADGLLSSADRTQLSTLTSDLSGKADLVNGKLSTSQIPDLAITEYLGVVANQTAMLALTGEKGDWCVRSDDGKVYVITGTDATQASSWTALSYPAVAATPWATSGSDINYTAGKVLIGSSTANDYALRVTKTGSSHLDKVAYFEAGTNSTTCQIALKNNTGTAYIQRAANQLRLSPTSVSDGILINTSTTAGIGTSVSPTFSSGHGGFAIHGGHAELKLTDSTTGQTASAGVGLELNTISTVPTLIVQNRHNGPINFHTNDTEQLIITSDGKMLLGLTTAIGTDGLQIGGSGNAGNSALYRFDANDSGPFLQLSKSRNATAGQNTVVQDDDELGTINFQGADGTDYHSAARIAAFVHGTPGNNDMPGRLVFSTTADGASSPTEKVRIDSLGNLDISNPGGNSYTNGTRISSTGKVASYVSNSTSASDERIYVYNGSTTSYKAAIYANGDILANQATFNGAVTLQNNLDMQDNDKILLGTGDDLQIYHDGSHSYISDEGTGQLTIMSNGAGIELQKGTTEFMGRFIADGAVELYYDNVKKLETKSDGVDITGELECDTLEVDGSGDMKIRMHGSSNPYIRFDEGTTYRGYIQYHSTQNALLLGNQETNSIVNITGSLSFTTGGSTYSVWHAGNDGSGSGLDADLLDGYDWNSNNKNVYGNQIIASDWFRNDAAGEGLYNNVTAKHFFSAGTNYWHLDSTNGLILYDGYNVSPGHATNRKGYLYHDSNGFGLLNSNGNWIVNSPHNSTFSNILVVGGHEGNNHHSSIPTVRMSFGGGSDFANYHFGVNSENYGGNYTKLDLRWHTGIRMGAQESYGGVRIYTNEDLTTNLVQFNGSNAHTHHHTWLEFSGNHGIYHPTNGAHFISNQSTSYSPWQLYGSKGGYTGIVLTYSSQKISLGMFDSSGNGGTYNEIGARWHTYYHHGNTCLGINGSSTSSTYGCYVTGALYASDNIVAYSDARKKTNITTITSALSKVLNLRGVTYNKIQNDKSVSEKTEIGVIAQEVEKVVPEVVTYAEDIDQYGVSYGNLTALLIEAVKEQQSTIDNLIIELKELKASLA